MTGVLGVAVAVVVAASDTDLKATLSAKSPRDRAISRYLELAEAKKASPAELTELGVLLASSDRLRDAERWLREATKADKHSFDAWYRLGLVQQRRADCSAAAKSFARALRERPEDAYARFMLAVAKERCGSKRSAITEYARAFKVMPDLADPEKNPMVLDSKVQTQASLTAYRQRVATGTFPVTSVDPAAVRAMMEAQPAAALTPAPAAKPAAAIPAPQAIPVPTPLPVGAPRPAPTPAPTPAPPPPGAPGGGDPLRDPGR